MMMNKLAIINDVKLIDGLEGIRPAVCKDDV